MSSSSHVEGIVNAHIDEVWKTFKGFGQFYRQTECVFDILILRVFVRYS